MPKIREYGSPQLEYQARQTRASTARFQTGEGQAIQNFGRAIGDIGMTIYQNEVQDDLIDANVGLTDLRSQVTQEIDDQIRDGSIDVEKMSTSLTERIDKMGENIRTPKGRAAFERESARLRAYVTKSAARGQAHVKGEKAKAAWLQSLGQASSSLQMDPLQFDEVRNQLMTNIDDQVAEGLIPAALADEFKRKSAIELAQGAIRGWAQVNPDQAERMVNDGWFDEYLTGDVKNQALAGIRTEANAQRAEIARARESERNLQEAATEEWYAQNFDKIVRGQLPISEIKNSPLKPHAKFALIDKIRQTAERGDGSSNPKLMNQIYDRVLLPKGDPNRIEDPDQLIQFIGQGLTRKDYERIRNKMKGQGPGSEFRDMEKMLFDAARKQIAKDDPFMGAGPMGEQNLARFREDYENEKARRIKEKLPLYDLINPNSKDSFWKQIQSPLYSINPTDVLRAQAEKQKQGQAPDVEYVRAIEVSTGRKVKFLKEQWDRVDKNKYQERR